MRVDRCMQVWEPRLQGGLQLLTGRPESPDFDENRNNRKKVYLDT